MIMQLSPVMAATAQCLITIRSACFAAFWDMRQKKDRGNELVWKVDSGVEHLFSAKVQIIKIACCM